MTALERFHHRDVCRDCSWFLTVSLVSPLCICRPRWLPNPVRAIPFLLPPSLRDILLQPHFSCYFPSSHPPFIPGPAHSSSPCPFRCVVDLPEAGAKGGKGGKKGKKSKKAQKIIEDPKVVIKLLAASETDDVETIKTLLEIKEKERKVGRVQWVRGVIEQGSNLGFCVWVWLVSGGHKSSDRL